MRILLTGADGMLAHAVRAHAESHLDVVPLGRSALDVTNRTAVDGAVRTHAPDVVLNCAAFSQVDAAEEDPVRAYAVNAAGPLWLAEACRSHDARLVHISTDYVFDGTQSTPYREDDRPHPLNVYGRSKLASEMAVRDVLGDRALIVRTQWLFGTTGRHFVSTVLARARTGERLRVVDDQFGSPTFAPDLAAALLALIGIGASGTMHVTNAGSASWFQVAQAAVATAGVSADLMPCSTRDVPRPARRPAYSVLAGARFRSTTDLVMRDWRAALTDCLAPAGPSHVG